MNQCRDLARFANLYRGEMGSKRVSLIGALLCAFPYELRAHLVGEGRRARPTRERLLPSALEARLERSSNRPLLITRWLAMSLKEVADSETYSSRERLTTLSHVNQLSSFVGACERLLQTPVPLNYARHTSRFLTLWCLTLPLSLVTSIGALVVPVAAFVTWCLFGIQEIGLYIEHCALDDGSIFMDRLSHRVALDVSAELCDGRADSDAELLEQASHELGGTTSPRQQPSQEVPREPHAERDPRADTTRDEDSKIRVRVRRLRANQSNDQYGDLRP